MKTIHRVRDVSKPEPEPEKVLGHWLARDEGNEIDWLIQEGRGSGHALATLTVNGVIRCSCLPESMGLPLDKQGRIVDCTPDQKAEVFKELLAACEVARGCYSSRTATSDQLDAAIAKAKELEG